ncbi:MAG: hypothetical protein RQ752_16625 [Thermohalobaculum sp.]|nr:hypothetical protein [Thermohalobaculum sp.]
MNGDCCRENLDLIADTRVSGEPSGLSDEERAAHIDGCKASDA